MFGLAGALFVLGAASPRAAVAWVVALTSLACSALAGIVSRGKHFAWIVFLAIAVAAWLGSRP